MSGSWARSTWALTWGTPAIPTTQCPGDLPWVPGGDVAANYSITNPAPSKQVFHWSVESERDWPGLPLSGTVVVDGSATETVPVMIPVPDTAAAGTNAMVFRAIALSGLQSPTPCSHHLRDASTPTEVALVSADASPGAVTLVWFSASDFGLAATVDRRSPDGSWVTLGEARSDGTGRIAYVDRTAEAGKRYAYRLSYVSDGQALTTPEVWVDVPVSPTFWLRAPASPPGTNQVNVLFSLPSSAPATLTLYDVAGRSLVTREVGGLGPGSHELDLASGARFPAGVYGVRLAQGERRASARVIVIR